MRIRKMMVFMLLAAFMALPFGGATAAATLTGQQTVEGLVGLHPANNTYAARLGGNAFAVFSADGRQLSASYGQIDIWQSLPYYFVVSDTSGMNSRGLVDGDGREIIPPVYGRIDVASDRWILACVVENWSDVVSTDVYFDGRKIGTLSAEDFTVSSYYAAHGAYLGISGGQAGYYLNSRFERVEGTADYFVTEEYFYDWRDGCVYHPATGQHAFDPTCTLTEDEVERAVWYNDQGDFVDLQGRVVSSGPSPYREYDNVEYFGGSYLQLRSGNGLGIADLRGGEVLPALYSQLGGSTQSYFAAGYQAVLRDGRLSWVDLAGNVTAAIDYSMNEGDLQGFYQNGLFIYTRALGETVVFTATAGELPQRYEDAVPVASPRQRLLCVKLGGLWGAIDLDGNTVIPFEHASQLQISADGTVAVEPGTRVVYTVSYDDGPVATAVPAQPAATLAPGPAETASGDDSWICPTCGQLNDLNFCYVDGTARPVQPAACQSCGYVMPADITPSFCPNCGAALQ